MPDETQQPNEYEVADKTLTIAIDALKAVLETQPAVPGSTVVGGVRGHLGAAICEFEARQRDLKEQQNNG